MKIAARFWIPLLAAALALGGWLLWSNRPREVKLADARIGPAVELVYATGYVEAEQPVSVAARVTAPVSRVLVEEGERVRRGQPLLLLDAAEQRGLLAQAAAERQRAGLQEARMLTLFRQGWVTRAARDQAVATARTARAAEESARARIAQYAVVAGIDGIVLKRDVEPGDLASPTRTLMQLGDPARVRITATVDERDVPLVHLGQAALLRADAWPDRAIPARVYEITPAGDPRERAFRVRLHFDQAVALPMGLTVEVNIVTRRIDRALLVPADALDADHLWVVEDGRAQRRAVKRGITGAEQVQIVSGLKAGETVIVDPPDALAEGERVRKTKAGGG